MNDENLTGWLSIIGTLTGCSGLLMSVITLILNRRDKNPRLKVTIDHEVIPVKDDADPYPQPPHDFIAITIRNPTLFFISVCSIFIEFTKNKKRRRKEITIDSNLFLKSTESLPFKIGPFESKILASDMDSFYQWINADIRNNLKIQVFIQDATRKKPYKSNRLKRNKSSFYF